MGTLGPIILPTAIEEDTLGADGDWVKVGAQSDLNTVLSEDGDTSYWEWSAIGNPANGGEFRLTFSPDAGVDYLEGADAYSVEAVYQAYVINPANFRVVLVPSLGDPVTWEDNFSPSGVSWGSNSTQFIQVLSFGAESEINDPSFQAYWYCQAQDSGLVKIFRLSYFALRITSHQHPDAPSSVGVSSSVTLTPNLTGMSYDPDGDQHNAVEFEVRRVSDNALMWASGWISIGAFEAGRNNFGTFSKAYGGTALVDGTQYKVRARTRDTDNLTGDWSGFTTWTPLINDAPTISLLSPSAGAVLGTLTPTLSITFTDPDAGDVFQHYEIEVRRQSDSVSFLDTGQVATSAGEKAAARVDKVYNGTTLVTGTTYEWRARGWDVAGAVSAFTSWRAFSIQAIPNPPTITAPSGFIDTLTPTIQGTYNQASGGTETHFQYRIYSFGGAAIYTSGDLTPDISVGSVYGGAPALAWGTAYQVDARSKDSNGNYSDWSAKTAFTTRGAPLTPTSLSPDGAVTGDTTPTLSWTHNPGVGSDAQTEAKVYLRVAGGAYVTGYDPKTLSQSTGSHTVTETLTASPTDYEWWVTTKGNNAGHSAESDHAEFTVAGVPTVTVTEPAAPGETFPGPEFLVEWTFSGGSGVQQDYRVRIYASDQTTVLLDSGVTGGADLEYLVSGAGILLNNTDYYLRLTVRDTLSQSADSGFIAFDTAWTPPSTPTGFGVTTIGDQA